MALDETRDAQSDGLGSTHCSGYVKRDLWCWSEREMRNAEQEKEAVAKRAALQKGVPQERLSRFRWSVDRGVSVVR